MLYRMSQDERSVFWKVVISVILSKKLYTYMCSIPNGFRDRAMDVIVRKKQRQDLLSRATRHVLTRVAKCIDVDGGIFENVLY
jgi:hypothetical protein